MENVAVVVKKKENLLPATELGCPKLGVWSIWIPCWYGGGGPAWGKALPNPGFGLNEGAGVGVPTADTSLTLLALRGPEPPTTKRNTNQ